MALSIEVACTVPTVCSLLHEDTSFRFTRVV
jgi:hypothetical protein